MHFTPDDEFLGQFAYHAWTSALQSADRHVVDVIAMAAIIEEFIAELISEYFAADQEKAEYLADNLVRKLSNDRKLGILAHIATRSQRVEVSADLVPKIREVFNLRNLLAHSYSTGKITMDGEDITFEHAVRSKGTHQQTTLKVSIISQTIDWLTTDAISQLARLRYGDRQPQAVSDAIAQLAAIHYGDRGPDVS